MMKRVICALLLLTAVVVCYTAVRFSGNTPQLTFDAYGRYSGFAFATEEYSPAQAAADGCVVVYEMETVANSALWRQFTDDTQAGRSSSVRIAQFYEDFASLTDVIYIDGRYHVFYSDSEFYEDTPYRYLLTLSGTVSGAARSSWVTVLTDDPALTFEQVMYSFLSDDSADADALPAFAWVRVGVDAP